jgi:hypothetical protein
MITIYKRNPGGGLTMKGCLYFLKKWILFGLRMVVGCVILKTGYDLASGNLPGTASFSSDPITPVFIILLGCYTLLSSLLHVFTKH